MSELTVVVAGAGVIGLSLAYELTHSPGVRVVLVDRDEPGQASSWAGAGIVTPAAPIALRPIDRLRELSGRTLAAWSERLKAETGIDNEYVRCGALELALTAEGLPGLERAAAEWRGQGVAIEPVPPGRVRELEPALAPNVAGAYLLPDEAQIRNPRHVAALVAACARRGVEVRTGTPVRGLAVVGGKDGSRVTGLVTDGGTIEGDAVVVAAGAWSAALLETIGVSLPVRPVRGQIALLAPPAPLLSRVIWIGARYLVPRRGGHVLVGSTEEDAGFAAHPTAEGVRGLLDLAVRTAPGLAEVPFERAWAGLRPGSPDGLPYLGPVPGHDNLYVAAGHFRAGLELSAGTAVVLAQLLRGEAPEVPLEPFRLERAVTSSAAAAPSPE